MFSITVPVREWRSRIPIHGYIGANGAGKTMCMVFDTMLEPDFGRSVLSTVRLTDFRNPRPCEGFRINPEGKAIECDIESNDHSTHLVAHPFYSPLTKFIQLFEAGDNSTVLFDEISSSFSARSSMSLPSAVLKKIKQLRKGDSIVRYTCPSYMDADVALRRVTQGVTMCSSFVGVDVPGRLWRAHKLFRHLTYDAQKLNDLDGNDRAQDKEAKKIRAERFGMVWGPRCGAFQAYDTYWTASELGWVDESGKCIRCGGSRPSRKCKCEELEEVA